MNVVAGFVSASFGVFILVDATPKLNVVAGFELPFAAALTSVEPAPNASFGAVESEEVPGLKLNCGLDAGTSGYMAEVVPKEKVVLESPFLSFSLELVKGKEPREISSFSVVNGCGLAPKFSLEPDVSATDKLGGCFFSAEACKPKFSLGTKTD